MSWTGVWVHGDEGMTGIDHMPVSTAVHNDFGARTRDRAVIEVTGNDGGLVRLVCKVNTVAVDVSVKRCC